MSGEWATQYAKTPRLRLATIGRRTGKRHEVTIDFVVHDGHVFVTGAKMGRDWMKNALKNPAVEVTIDGITKPMRAEVVDSVETRKIVEGFYRKKYPVAARLLRLAREGSTIFELKGDS